MVVTGRMTFMPRLAVQYRLDLERARINLFTVCNPAGLPAALAEVGRRAKFMGDLAAAQSVYDDVVTGRWRP